jgi:serine protease AprX
VSRFDAAPCPLCLQDAALVRLDAETQELVAANVPGHRRGEPVCTECARRFTQARVYFREHMLREGLPPILPTAVRLGASERYRGRGVTIAFLDAGFHAHPDLVQPRDRILRYVDVTNPAARRADLERPDESSWHGMMTSVVACGNGRLSNGLYRGLASEAELVLVRCGSARRVRHDDIRRGFDWVIRNRRRYGVRVVNVSVGGDYEASYLHDALSQSAERATREGLLVCAAVGNLGHAPGHPVLPPGSAPSVLTVGGLDDKNRMAFAGYDMYHSSYGPTLDGLQKPELIAPGIFVAAPILPGTPTAAQARLLSLLAEAPEAELRALLSRHAGIDAALDAAAGLDPALIRQLVRAMIRDNNVISGHYKHVDGTSFASPIVASVAAQMLEACPSLRPHEIKRLLVRTARRLPHVPVDRQGWGAVDPRRALAEAVRRGRRARRETDDGGRANQAEPRKK